MNGFTEAYFREELNRFREAFGTQSFWDKTESQRNDMIRGLSHVYFNIENEDNSMITTEQLERWSSWLDNTLVEYERRKTMLQLRPMKPRPDCPECKRPHGVAFVEGIWKCFMVDHKTPMPCMI